MTKIKTTNQIATPKRLSPELAELLHMLRSLETDAQHGTLSAQTR